MTAIRMVDSVKLIISFLIKDKKSREPALAGLKLFDKGFTCGDTRTFSLRFKSHLHRLAGIVVAIRDEWH